MTEPFTHHADVYAVLDQEAGMCMTQPVNAEARHLDTFDKTLEHT